MAIAPKLLEINQVKEDLKQAIIDKGVSMNNVPFTDYPAKVLEISSGGGGPAPSTGSQSFFTGATIPLTYKDNTVDHEINYEYKSATHNITITGLDGRATIIGNGTKDVRVEFDVSSATSSLKSFTITCVNGSQTLGYNGLHAHYGTAVSGILTFASLVATPDGSDGSIDTNYAFIETGSTVLPLFSSQPTLWNGIYSHQVLAVNIDKFSSTGIGAAFLYNCYSFNQPLTIPSNVTSIGNNFLCNCYSFNQPLTIPSGVTSIGNNSINNCPSFNQPLTIPSSLTIIRNYFIAGCSSFNQPLTIPSNVTSIGINFLHNCYSFNQPLTIPSNVTSIGSYFLVGCNSFNQPLTIPNSVTSIGQYFLQNCYSFNQPLTIPSNVTSIENYFLNNCHSFNQSLTIPNSVTSIGRDFLSICYSFNQPITIPSNVTSIGNNFLQNCYSFYQPITIPSNLTSIGTSFLYNCYSLTAVLWFAAVYPTDNNSLSQLPNTKATVNGTGIIIYGDQRSNLIAALPDRASVTFRKLINGGS